jgi:hypothetical protein
MFLNLESKVDMWIITVGRAKNRMLKGGALFGDSLSDGGLKKEWPDLGPPSSILFKLEARLKGSGRCLLIRPMPSPEIN